MRVLVLANNASGLYKFRRELLDSLLARYEVFFSTPKGEYTDAMVQMGCNFMPCDVMETHGTNPIKELKLITYYKSIIQKVKPDVVLTYTIKPNVYGGIVCGRIGIPYIENITGLGTAVENKGLMQKITLFLYKKGLQKAKKVFFQNEENMDFMVNNGIVNGSYELIPGSGVNLKDYQLLPYPHGDTIDFVFIARIIKEKGIDQYLDAAVSTTKQYPMTKFHICGYLPAEYKETIDKYVSDGRIIYHGLVKDMKPIYGMASCIVHPTYYPEGLSNVLLEASASGRPCIASNRSGCREVIDDGVNGFLVKQKDSEDLIARIEQFLGLSIEDRERMGIAGRKKVEAEFDREIVIRKYNHEIEKAMNIGEALNDIRL